jgi:hypothetical protein
MKSLTEWHVTDSTRNTLDELRSIGKRTCEKPNWTGPSWKKSFGTGWKRKSILMNQTQKGNISSTTSFHGLGLFKENSRHHPRSLGGETL